MALGCIIYELYTLNRCFDNSFIFSLCKQIINEEHGKIDLNIYNQDLQNLINLLLEKTYKERPDIEQIYKIIYQFLK